MAYSNRFVACVLIDGRPQKELANGTVPLPFGAEYSLRFRNKHDRRAVVKFSIDGEDESGPGYVIPAHGYIDIHRHAGVDQAFCFVSTDSEEAVDAGKNGPNHDMVKGLVEARFYLEKKRQTPKWKPVRPQYPTYPYWIGGSGCGGGWQSSSTYCSTSLGDTLGDTDLGLGSETISSYCCDVDDGSRSILRSCSVNNTLSDGCTVGGEATGQDFYGVWVDTESTCTTVKLFLRGMSVEDEAYPYPFTQKPTQKGRPNKLRSLEAENERLRAKIAEIENERLKEKLESLEG